MKKLAKIILYGTAIFIAILIIAGIYMKTVLPNVGDPEELEIEGSTEQIARGEYLANHVMLCMDCHSDRNYSLFSGPPHPGTKGLGGDRFDRSMGLPGVFVSPNITPEGIGNWTDGELYRLITTGVKKNGEPIFPVMPYQSYGKLDPEDIKAVIAYIRTLAPQKSNIPPREIDFPVNFIIRTMPSKATPTTRPNKEDVIAYGEYLVTAAACGECHTKFEKGKFVGPYLGGGRAFPSPNGNIVRSSNLTFHSTGLGNKSKEDFVRQFKQYSPELYTPTKVGEGEFQTIMPWTMYAGMDTTDLASI